MTTKTAPTLARLLAKADRSGDCWLWTGRLDCHGYGQISVGNRRQGAHRLAYTLLAGPIPDGLVIDHLCRVRHCVNPARLEPVTHAENVRRGIPHNSTKTHCPEGHAYDDANTYVAAGRRGCRACRRAAVRRHEAAKRGVSA